MYDKLGGFRKTGNAEAHVCARAVRTRPLMLALRTVSFSCLVASFTLLNGFAIRAENTTNYEPICSGDRQSFDSFISGDKDQPMFTSLKLKSVVPKGGLEPLTHYCSYNARFQQNTQFNQHRELSTEATKATSCAEFVIFTTLSSYLPLYSRRCA